VLKRYPAAVEASASADESSDVFHAFHPVVFLKVTEVRLSHR
jgi:hypothetical protein